MKTSLLPTAALLVVCLAATPGVAPAQFAWATNARRIVRIRSVLSFLAALFILAVEISLGTLMVSCLGQTSCTRTPTEAQNISVDFSDCQP